MPIAPRDGATFTRGDKIRFTFSRVVQNGHQAVVYVSVGAREVVTGYRGVVQELVQAKCAPKLCPTSITIDSRVIAPGKWFWAVHLYGDNALGHNISEPRTIVIRRP